MNEPVVYEFNRQPVPMHRHEGDLWVTSEHIGAALGYAEPNRAITKIYNRNREELDLHTCTPKLVHQAEDGIEQRRSVRCFNEEGIMIITMLSRQPKAAEFRAWAVKILKAYRHGELVLNQPSERDHLLELCISEAGKCNIAALSTLVSRYGYEPSIKEQQLKILSTRYGKRVPLAAQDTPLLVRWFIDTFLLHLRQDLYQGGDSRFVRAIRDAGLNIDMWEDGTRFIDHTTSQILGAVADVAQHDGVPSDITPRLFGEWLARLHADIAAVRCKRKPLKLNRGVRVFRLTLCPPDDG